MESVKSNNTLTSYSQLTGHRKDTTLQDAYIMERAVVIRIAPTAIHVRVGKETRYRVGIHDQATG